ncbi:class II aldolase/adducin family protein [Pseudomonas sp. L13]|uniref:class II aldolase/adducin family protein n=1 Tax=Pseudomonas sp. L13 TaxID=343985 RepID=UPI00137AF608|nr:class II aldolase/adducin family protein [Pseudomonas sp. L13]NCE89185.1 class II aldolase/adducin family protein [Pseudomonas sp. L13]
MANTDAYDDPEWDARCELAALYRLMAHFRMTDLIDTHISLRVPGSADHFLINKYGVLFEHMRASDLVVIDYDGVPVTPGINPADINQAGFIIHSAIHGARHDLHCVVHTHTAAGMAVSSQEDGLLPISQHALKFYGKLAYHQYEGIALHESERDRLVSDLGPHKAMILRNHGLLTAGSDCAEAFHEVYFLERACQAQVLAMGGGAKLSFPCEEVRRLTAAQFADDSSAEIIQRTWSAAKQLILSQQRSYCS